MLLEVGESASATSRGALHLPLPSSASEVPREQPRPPFLTPAHATICEARLRPPCGKERASYSLPDLQVRVNRAAAPAGPQPPPHPHPQSSAQG